MVNLYAKRMQKGNFVRITNNKSITIFI